MLSVKELRALAAGLGPDKLRAQLGPFVLIQRPSEPVGARTDPMGLPMNAMATEMARPEEMSQRSLGLLFQVDDLLVATLPPLAGTDELTVGRQPDCDLVLDDKSVSKRHAALRWDASSSRRTVRDLGSTNGTVLNASILVRREVSLRDGDIVSFGDVPFWYLLTETLHAYLARQSATAKLGARSG
ncbi:MAG: FHA domain-containing protein [Myxococcales bacterium]|nr:FHA domain-containing protein [Myxococcales bacterium]